MCMSYRFPVIFDTGHSKGVQLINILNPSTSKEREKEKNDYQSKMAIKEIAFLVYDICVLFFSSCDSNSFVVIDV